MFETTKREKLKKKKNRKERRKEAEGLLVDVSGTEFGSFCRAVEEGCGIYTHKYTNTYLSFFFFSFFNCSYCFSSVFPLWFNCSICCVWFFRPFFLYYFWRRSFFFFKLLLIVFLFLFLFFKELYRETARMCSWQLWNLRTDLSLFFFFDCFVLSLAIFFLLLLLLYSISQAEHFFLEGVLPLMT